MKRIPQDVAVQSLCYTIKPDQKIIIIDRLSIYDEGSVTFSGTKNELTTGYIHEKELRSKVVDIKAENDILYLTVNTHYDNY